MALVWSESIRVAAPVVKCIVRFLRVFRHFRVLRDLRISNIRVKRYNRPRTFAGAILDFGTTNFCLR